MPVIPSRVDEELRRHGYIPVSMWGVNIPELDTQIQAELDKNADAKIVGFAVIDDVHPSIFRNHLNVHIFRTSMLKSHKGTHEYVLPYIYEPVDTQMPILSKGALPRVAFCGQPNNPYLRKKSVVDISSSNKIQSNFLIRASFWGGNPHDPTIIREFRENMASCEFNLCPRGNGNFSMRLYQTLSAGRIPIIVQTEAYLPWEESIPWSDIAVIVHETDNIVEKIIEFWLSHDIEKVQQQCYEQYQIHFNEEGFKKHILETIGVSTAAC